MIHKKLMRRVGAYQRPCTMKYKQPVSVSATTLQPKRVGQYLYRVQGQVPLTLIPKDMKKENKSG